MVPFSQESLRFGLSHPGISAVISCLLTATIIARGIHKSIENSYLGRFLIQLGQYSYSIYLVHFPIIVLFNYMPFGGTELGYRSSIELIILLALITFSSVALYQFTEAKRSIFFQSKRPIYLLSIIFLILISAPLLNQIGISNE